MIFRRERIEFPNQKQATEGTSAKVDKEEKKSKIKEINKGEKFDLFTFLILQSKKIHFHAKECNCFSNSWNQTNFLLKFRI